MIVGKKVFIDSNVLIYLLDSNKEKKIKAESFFQPDFFICTQVVSENVNICIKKLKQTKEVAFAHGRALMNNFQVLTINESVLLHSFEISTNYQLSYWDSLIIATALQHECDLLSEDLQPNFLIEKKLRVINPFTTSL